MSLTTTSKTGSFLPLFFLFGRVTIVIELFLRLVICLLVGGFLRLFIILFLAIRYCTSMNRVYSFCHSNNSVDILVSSELGFHVLPESWVYTGKELLYERVVTYSVFW